MDQSIEEQLSQLSTDDLRKLKQELLEECEEQQKINIDICNKVAFLQTQQTEIRRTSKKPLCKRL